MAASISETYDFVVEGVPTIDARHAAGSISFEPGEVGAVHIVVTKRVRNLLGGFFGSAREITEDDLAGIPVTVTQAGQR
ncbi:MAG TPA: hypothetical protein VKQ36_02370, partial [Ktedonobacterales bacterium]|nr:hypothetical protein [Ktedonobacterales bacterium]